MKGAAVMGRAGGRAAKVGTYCGTDQLRKCFSDNGTRFLSVRKRSYKWGKGGRVGTPLW